MQQPIMDRIIAVVGERPLSVVDLHRMMPEYPISKLSYALNEAHSRGYIRRVGWAWVCAFAETERPVVQREWRNGS